MRGIVRPSRRRLGPELYRRWQGHLCGLCLTLGDVAGQPARVLTGYDVLLLGVLVEAQAGPQSMVGAAPCPLRGFRPAVVTAPDSPAARLSAAAALLTGAAGLTDKLHDGELPAAGRRVARRAAVRMERRGQGLADGLHLGTGSVLQAPERAAAAEADPASQLDTLLRPTGDAVSDLFAHTAVVAGRPENADALAEAGQAFGRLVHLLDAVSDVHDDTRRGRFNPLLATRTPADDAARLTAELHEQLVRALRRTALCDRRLAEALLDREVARAINRVLPQAAVSSIGAEHGAHTCEHPPRRGSGSGLVGALTGIAAVAATTTTAMTTATMSDDGHPQSAYGYEEPRRGRFHRTRRCFDCCDCCDCCCCDC